MGYTPLSAKEHASLRLTRGTFLYLQNRPLVNISTLEAPQAALDLPLAFVKADDGVSLVTILSLDRNDNAQIGPKGLWMGGYIPAVIRANPFAMVAGEGQPQILVDLKSDWLSSKEGELLFDLDGSPTEILKNRIELLKTLVPNPNRDGPVFTAIEQSGLLEPWYDVSENLFRVNAKKFVGLDDQHFLSLRRKNALDIIYTHLISLPRINRIKNLAVQKKQLAQRQLQGMLRDEDQYSIRFDDDMIRFE